MDSELDSDVLHSLFAEKCAGDITRERHDQLETALRNSSQARRLWFLYCDVDTGLKDWATTENERDGIRLPTVEPPTTGASSRSLLTGLALVATLMLAITAAYWVSRPQRDQQALIETRADEVAMVTCMVNARWDGASEVVTGSTIAPSSLHLISGAALIEFFSGASVVLEGPAEFELISSNASLLRSGRMNAHVPPQANGFTVKTLTEEIVDHGTDFGLVLGADRTRELHVFSGRVEVKSGERSRDVHEGEAVQLDQQDSDVFDSDRSAFLSERELVQQSEQVARNRQAAWREASLALSKDSAAICHFRLDHSGESVSERIRTLVNSALNASPGSGGSLVGGQRSAGRWPGKEGIAFSRPGDRIRITVSQPMKAVTLLAWVKVQSLTRWQNTLLAADSDSPGAIRWQLTKRGQLRFEVARDLGRTVSDWEAIESSPILTEDRLGKWTLLVTTFDRETIRHYANGQLVASGASYTPESLHIGTAEIANWSGETRRQLNAILDEFAVLDRVLSPEEIFDIYDYGRP